MSSDWTDEQEAEYQRVSMWLEESGVVASHPREVNPEDPRKDESGDED